MNSSAPTILSRQRARLPQALRDARVLGALTVLALMVLVALAAPWLAPHAPTDQDLLNTLLPPSWSAAGNADYPLGTDALGQCILSRLIYGTRIAVVIAGVAPLGAALLGCTLALLAGYRGGWIDWLVMRVVDVWMSFPAIVLALVLMVALSPGLPNVIAAIIMVDWTRFCRVIRSEVVLLRRREYVAAARIAGANHARVILRDILPGVMPMLISLISIEMGIAIVAESILKNVFSSPWGLILPVLCVVITVLATTLLGDGLRRSTDPRLLSRHGAAQ
jgi:peptide/nickel transport system permease protein